MKASDFARTTIRGLNPISPKIRLQPVTTVVAAGTTKVAQQGSARVTLHSGATVRTDVRLLNDALGVEATYRSRTPGVALVRGDTAKWVANGNAEIIVETRDEQLLVKAPVSQTDPTDVTAFHSWVTGALAQSAASAIDTLLAGKTPDEATLQLFAAANHILSTYARNSDGWFSSLNAKLTAVSVWSSRYGTEIRGTLVTPRHYVTCAHTPHAVGDTVRWVGVANVVCNRTVLATHIIPGTDVQIALLSAAVTPDITPAKVMPVDVRDYLENEAVRFGVPVIVPHFEGDVRVTNLVSWADTTAGHSGVVFNPPFPSEGNRRAFWRDLNTGGSGGPALMIVGGELMLVTTWTLRNLGPKYYEVDWAAAIDAVDALGAVTRTNEIHTSEDFTNGWWLNYPSQIANAAVAPNGLYTADLILAHTYQMIFGELWQGAYTWSCYVKDIDAGVVRLKLRETTYTDFNLATGEIIQIVQLHDENLVPTRASIEDAGNGWWRVSMTTYLGGNVYAGFERINNGSFYAWGAQAERGHYMTSYTPTAWELAPASGSGHLPTMANLAQYTWHGVGGWKVRYESDFGTFNDPSGTIPTTNDGTVTARVRSWKDRAGSAADMIANNLDWGPLATASDGIGGVTDPAHMLRCDPNPLAGLPQATMYLLYRSNAYWYDTPNGGPVKASLGAGSNHHNWFGGMYEDFGSTTRFDVGNTIEIGDWAVLRVTSTPTQWTLWVNGVQKVTSPNTVGWHEFLDLFSNLGTPFVGNTKKILFREATPTVEEDKKIRKWLAPDLDDDAAAYIHATLAVDRGNIHAWTKGLKALGLWEHSAFWLFRYAQNHGSGSNVKAGGGLGLADGVIDRPEDLEWTPNGIQFNGGVFVGSVDLPDLSAHMASGFTFFAVVNGVGEDNFSAPDIRTTTDQYVANMSFNQSYMYPGIIPNATRAGANSHSPATGPIPPDALYYSGAAVFGDSYQRGYYNGALKSNQTGLAPRDATGEIQWTRINRGNGNPGIVCSIQMFLSIPLTDAQVTALHALYRATIGLGLGV